MILVHLYQIIESPLCLLTSQALIPDDLSKYRAVIIDIRDAAMLGATSLKEFVGGGGGLLLLAGMPHMIKEVRTTACLNPYCPNIRAAEYRGGRKPCYRLWMLLGVLQARIPTTNVHSSSYRLPTLLNIVDKVGRDSTLGVVAFGGVTGKDRYALNGQ